jgi:multimeric flavodoxin WrbA
MPLCHWPYYQNHSLGQINDWMADIYPMWAAAHGIMIVTPVHWYQVPTTLQPMINRLVCADGGNPDPSSTSGKDREKAKDLETKGPLAGRAYSVVVHGDAAGAESLRRSLSDWVSDMGLIGAGHQGETDRYVGYYEPYATAHLALDAAHAFHEETRNAARPRGKRQTATARPVGTAFAFAGSPAEVTCRIRHPLNAARPLELRPVWAATATWSGRSHAPVPESPDRVCAPCTAPARHRPPCSYGPTSTPAGQPRNDRIPC